jgi:hypothetical protein
MKRHNERKGNAMKKYYKMSDIAISNPSCLILNVVEETKEISWS